ncbi:orotidine-5'-phosphate decarboxylase [Patescibacteria group bacterium]
MAELTARDRIIAVLDVKDIDIAAKFVNDLTPYVGGFKIGLEFIVSMIVSLITTEPMDAICNLKKLRKLFEALNGKIFWDNKFYDIPRTIAGASRAVAKLGIKMFNVHCLSGPEAMKAAKKAAGDSIVLGVTILTSLDYEDLVKMGLAEELNIADEDELRGIEKDWIERLAVRRLAHLAQECGLDGVIASPQEIEAIRGYCQPEFLIVTPGIRPEWAPKKDQKRTMTPGEAIKIGGDNLFLVIGSPITDPPEEIGTPIDAVKLIIAEVEEALEQLAA